MPLNAAVLWRNATSELAVLAYLGAMHSIHAP
jgi:hypothetical protein